MRSRWRAATRVLVVGALASAVGGSAASAQVNAHAAAGAVPARTVQVSSTDLHAGDVITLSGTGCTDGAGSGVGHYVAAGLAADDLPEYGPFAIGPKPVAADGSFSITGTLAEPVPNGRASLVAFCLPGSEPNTRPAFGYDPIAVTATSPPVTGIALAGDIVTIDNPCAGLPHTPPFAPETYASLNDKSTFVAQLDQLAPLEATAARFRFQVPGDVASGRYDLEVRCLAHRIDRPQRILHAELTYTRPSPTPSTTAAPASGASTASAGGARPVHGSATYTG